MILILSYRRKSWVHHSTLDPVQNLIYFSGPKNDQKMIHYWWIQKKRQIVDPSGPLNYTSTKSFINFSLIKISKKYFIFSSAFYLIMCLMKSPKNFEKIFILKKWQQVSFCCTKTDFGEIPLKRCIFRNEFSYFH